MTTFSQKSKTSTQALSFSKRKVAFLVPCIEGHLAVNPEEVCYCEVAGKNASKWHFKNGVQATVKQNLRQSAKLLLPHHFSFANPCVLVNLHEVFQITKGTNSKLVLANGQEFEVSVRNRKEILERFKAMEEEG